MKTIISLHIDNTIVGWPKKMPIPQRGSLIHVENKESRSMPETKNMLYAQVTDVLYFIADNVNMIDIKAKTKL